MMFLLLSAALCLYTCMCLFAWLVGGGGLIIIVGRLLLFACFVLFVVVVCLFCFGEFYFSGG